MSDYRRELEAIMKFSQAKVRLFCLPLIVGSGVTTYANMRSMVLSIADASYGLTAGMKKATLCLSLWSISVVGTC